MLSTSQSTTPFQFGMGSARNWNFRPTTGSKSLFIIHCPRSGPSVSARHSFSGGCGNTLSTTRVRGLSVELLMAVGLLLSAALLMAPSFPELLQADQTGHARRRRSHAASPPSAPAPRAVRDSEFRVPRGDALPA